MGRTWNSALVGLAISALAASAAARSAGSTRPAAGPIRVQTAGLRLSAVELAYQPEQHRISLRGQVVVELGELRLQAGQLTVLLDAQGRPQRLQASGGVVLQASGASGRADQATLLTHERALELTGHARVRVSKLGLELEGERVRLDLPSGRLSVQAARARLQSPAAPVGAPEARAP